jgi:phage tail sheath protein FI
MATNFDFLPGVRILEVQLGAPPVSGVGTSTAGFVGKVGKDNRLAADNLNPVLITSFDDFAAKFIVQGTKADGTPDAASPAVTKSTALSRAVTGFFLNGGTSCYVSLVDDDTSADKLKAGVALLGRLDDVQIIAVPGSVDKDVNVALAGQAEALGDRVAILDSPQSTDPTNDLKAGATAKRPGDSKYAAFYYPRIQVGRNLPDDKALEAISPVGHLAGVYANTDAQRGVHKAPANVKILGALGTEFKLTDAEQNVLNKDGVNAIRVFSGNVTVWGARTLQGKDAQDTGGDTLFRYINVRRLTNYVEQSLKAGLRFATFEPNNLALRQTIRRSVRGFLDGVFRDGALFGATPDEAYYVRFPDAFNRDEDRLAGKLVVEIGLRPAPPAEFIILRIGILTQSAATA